MLRQALATGESLRRQHERAGGAARTRGGLTGGYNADIAAWGEALPDSKSPIGRGSPSIEEWTHFMGASPLRRFALARLCLTSNL